MASHGVHPQGDSTTGRKIGCTPASGQRRKACPSYWFGVGAGQAPRREGEGLGREGALCEELVHTAGSVLTDGEEFSVRRAVSGRTSDRGASDWNAGRSAALGQRAESHMGQLVR